MVVRPEQVMAFYLKKMKTYFERDGMRGKEMVISVPSYATNAERQAYLDAADIAGVQCKRLMNENTATAFTYSYSKKAELNPARPRVVAFVDFGHSKLTVTFAQFLPDNTKIIGTYSNKNLGARDFDYFLLEHFA